MTADGTARCTQLVTHSIRLTSASSRAVALRWASASLAARAHPSRRAVLRGGQPGPAALGSALLVCKRWACPRRLHIALLFPVSTSTSRTQPWAATRRCVTTAPWCAATATASAVRQAPVPQAALAATTTEMGASASCPLLVAAAARMPLLRGAS